METCRDIYSKRRVVHGFKQRCFVLATPFYQLCFTIEDHSVPFATRYYLLEGPT